MSPELVPLTIRVVARTPSTVPVLLITGPVGVGKTRTASAASELLNERGIPHACVDLPQISKAFPARDDDPWNEELAHRNLACMWVTSEPSASSA
jgi:adenylylsulfate kinase